MTISAATEDPFASLSFPAQQQTTQIYISGRLTLLRCNPQYVGDWICAGDPPLWHRRLDANSYLWLRDRVHSAIESGKISGDFKNALATLSEITEIGIASGAFTTDEIGPGRRAPEWYEFSAGLPRWADDADF